MTVHDPILKGTIMILTLIERIMIILEAEITEVIDLVETILIQGANTRIKGIHIGIETPSYQHKLWSSEGLIKVLQRKR